MEAGEGRVFESGLLKYSYVRTYAFLGGCKSMRQQLPKHFTVWLRTARMRCQPGFVGPCYFRNRDVATATLGSHRIGYGMRRRWLIAKRVAPRLAGCGL